MGDISTTVRSESIDKRGLAELITARLQADAASLAKQWNAPEGTPTRHFLLDNLLPDDVARAIYNAFPQRDAIWVQQKSFRERKKTFAKLESVAPIIAAITDAFHENDVLKAVTNITSSNGLEADPELYAGGISMMGQGDFLNPHIDNSHDRFRRRYRRLNLLYYISPDSAT